MAFLRDYEFGGDYEFNSFKGFPREFTVDLKQAQASAQFYTPTRGPETDIFESTGEGIAGVWRMTTPALGVIEIGLTELVTMPSPGEGVMTVGGVPFIRITFENAPRGGTVNVDKIVWSNPGAFPSTKGKMKWTHSDPSNPRFLYIYDLEWEQKKTITGTVYDPNSDTKLPFSAYWVGPPGTKLPIVLTYVTTEPRVLPYAATAPLLPVAQTVPPETPTAPPPIVTEQIVATGQQTTVLLPTVSSVVPTAGQPLVPVLPPQPYIPYQPSQPYISINRPPEDLLPQPDQLTVADVSIQGAAAPVQAGILGGLSPTLMILLAGGAALLLFTGRKEEGSKRKRKR